MGKKPMYDTLFDHNSDMHGVIEIAEAACGVRYERTEVVGVG